VREASWTARASAAFAAELQLQGRMQFFAVFGGITTDVLVVVVGFANPKGIESFSPGLRGTSYPGVRIQKIHNPERVESIP
jgi:hypothetical protein